MKIWILLGFAFILTAYGQSMDTYIGTNHQAGTPGGIYSARLDAGTGKWSDLKLAADTANPTFLALAPNGRTLYAAIEASPGAVQAFAVGPDRTLTFRNAQPSGGDGTCHVSAGDGVVLVANYRGGSGAVFPVQSDGSLAQRSDLAVFRGSGPNAKRQQQPFGHAFESRGGFAYACDLGSDQVWAYRLEKGRLTPLDPPAGRVPPGSGPRHLAFSPDGRWVFVVNELIPGVTSFARDLETGKLQAHATRAALPEEAMNESVTAAEIVMHPSGKWLYVSNRGHDSVTVYSVDESGGLEVIENRPAGVRVPRSIAIDPTGRWLVAAGQADGRLVVHAIDPATGALALTDSVLEVPSPVCVVFAN